MAVSDPLTGVQIPAPPQDTMWRGTRRLGKERLIVVMPGHADAQCPEVGGSGTSGFAVAGGGAEPMDPTMTDELYWAIRIAKEVVRLGAGEKGLSMTYYDPGEVPGSGGRCLKNPDNPSTAWSWGLEAAKRHGFALEIHLDAWGPSGRGSGLIPQTRYAPSTIDESLAVEFGRYPRGFRNLGGPRRGVSLLEIGKLEAPLEPKLRNMDTRHNSIRAIAQRIVTAIEKGLAVPPQGNGQ